MCNIQPLLDFGVFGTDVRGDQFKVNKFCFEVQNPFEQYCLVPPTSRLELTNTCTPYLSNPLDSTYIFARIVAGRVRTLRDLPVLFASFPKNTSTQMWLATNVTNANDNFARVPAGYTRLAVSAIANHVLLLLAPLANNNLQVYALDEFGFFRPQGDLLQTTSDDVYQNLYVSQDGTQQFALLNQSVYQRQIEGGWTALGINLIRDIILAAADVIYVGANTIFFNGLDSFINFEGLIMFACPTQDRTHLIVGIFATAITTTIHLIEIATRFDIKQWLLNAGFPPSVTTLYSAIGTSSNASLTSPVFFTVTQGSSLVGVTLPVIGNLATFIIVPNQNVVRFYNNVAWVSNNAGNSVLNIVGGGPQIPMPLGATTQSVIAASQDGQDIWVFVDGRFYRVTGKTGPFLEQKDVYMNYNARLNDTSEPNMFPIADSLWYLGSVFLNVPYPIAEGTIIGISRHMRYRWLFGTTTISETEFPYTMSFLERINDFYLLTTMDNVVLYEDARVVVQREDSFWFWQNECSDHCSDPATFHNWISREQPLCTTNGLYIMFLEGNTVFVSYNVFNSAQFAKWCKQSDLEYMARGLQAQREFCFANLKVGNSFFDPRCSCVGGAQLFNELYPGLAMDSQTNGRLISHLPCLLTDCGNAFLQGVEESNVYNYTNEQCLQSDLVICSDVLVAKGSLDISRLTIAQNCGSNPSACLNSNECPIGSICVSGQCVLECTNDNQCTQVLSDPFAICNNGACLFSKNNNNNTTWMIITLIIILFLAIFFILLLVMFVPKSKQ